MTTWRYMTRFRCIGGECEDTCCASWGVEVSTPIADAIQAAVGETQTRKMISFYKEQHRTPERCGRIRMPPYQTCVMLNAQGMCGLQVAHGESVLPRTCISYPRSRSVHGEQVVLGGFLSCPEVARQALLHADGLELVDQPLPELRLNTDQTVDQDGAYFDLREEVSAALAEHGRDRPLAARLWLLARLAASSVARFNRTTTDPQPIRDLIASVGSPHYQADLLAELPDAPRPAFDDALVSALRLLAHENGIYVRPRASIAAALSVIDAEGLAPGRARWAPLEEALAGPLDRYIRFHMLSRWYTDAPDLGSHIDNLLLKLALIRLLVRTAPPAALSSDAERTHTFIQAVYGVDRMVEHDAWRFQARARAQSVGGSYFEQLADWIRF